MLWLLAIDSDELMIQKVPSRPPIYVLNHHTDSNVHCYFIMFLASLQCFFLLTVDFRVTGSTTDVHRAGEEINRDE